MEQIVEKNKCTGCTACMNICPKNAIKMITDNDGFKYPKIDQSKCINCGLCKKTCPVINTKSNSSINSCYVGYNKDEKERMNSSSGAIFSLIANYIIDNNGIVIGAGFDSNNQLKHIAVETKIDLEKLKKSKYLQSDLNNIFEFIKDNIYKRKILFVGTPCQVAGLKAFLKKDSDNLICIDLFCHGVPSPKLFKKYVEELEEKYHDKLLKYDFRDNSSGWDTYSNTAVFDKCKKTELRQNNDYMKLFLSDVALRESCFNCNFKLGNKYSDITLGDFWGVKNHYPEMYNNSGVSAIIINTDKGRKLFNEINSSIEFKECSIEEIVGGNSSLINSCNRPQKRDSFFYEIDNKTIKQLVTEYTPKQSIWKKTIIKFKRILKRFLKI